MICSMSIKNKKFVNIEEFIERIILVLLVGRIYDLITHTFKAQRIHDFLFTFFYIMQL